MSELTGTYGSYPMQLNSKVSHQVWVFNALKYFQLVCRLLDCFVIIRLESDLIEKQNKIKMCYRSLQIL